VQEKKMNRTTRLRKGEEFSYYFYLYPVWTRKKKRGGGGDREIEEREDEASLLIFFIILSSIFKRKKGVDAGRQKTFQLEERRGREAEKKRGTGYLPFPSSFFCEERREKEESEID